MVNSQELGFSNWITRASKCFPFLNTLLQSKTKLQYFKPRITTGASVASRENKNRYLFAYLKSLVDCGIFDHIYLNFLPVGHTHCDIDQLFSRVATFLKGDLAFVFFTMHVPARIVNMFKITCSFLSAHSAYTWDELAEAIRRSYVGINQVLVLKKFINWSASIDPYLNDAAKTDGMSGFCMFLVTYSSSVL
jgi:hypothetical protein